MFPNGRAGIAGSSETLLEDTVKRLILCALAVAGLCIPALATDPTPEQKAQIEKPMTMNNTGNEKKQVIFTHSAHAKTDCAFCHHKAVESNIYVGCAAKACHDNMDKKDKSEHGYYFTMHNKKSEKSCMGCHQKAVAENPDLKEKFKGCNPCHTKNS